MLIPVGTERDLTQIPYLSYALVAANVLVFLAVLFLVPPEMVTGVGAPVEEEAESPEAEVLEELEGPETAEEPGTTEVTVVQRNQFVVAAYELGFIPADVQWYAVISAMFLHGGWFHLLFNMLFLWIFGRHLEDVLGRGWFALLYFSSGIAALLLHYVMTLALAKQDMDIPAIGASGAIAGVLGLFAVRFYRTGVRIWVLFIYTVSLPAVLFLGAWLFNEVWLGVGALASATQTSVANWAHIGGFLYGMLMALVLHLETEAGEEYSLEDAEVAFQLGNWAEVIERFSDVLTREPENVRAHEALAKAYGMTRDDERSVYHYHSAISLLADRSEPRQTMLTYRDFKQMFPEQELPTSLRYQVACACEVGGDPVTALREFSAILEADPEGPQAEMSLLKKAQITLQHLHRPQEALALFQEFLAKHGSSLWAVAAQDGVQEAQAMISGHRRPSTGRPEAGRPRFPGR